MKTYLHRTSNLSLFWPLFHNGSQFLAPVKNRHFLRFIHNLCMVGTYWYSCREPPEVGLVEKLTGSLY